MALDAFGRLRTSLYALRARREEQQMRTIVDVAKLMKTLAMIFILPDIQ